MIKNSLILLLILFLLACKKQQDLSRLNETIYVRSEGSDMPVHMHGNLKSSVILLMVHGGPGGNGLDYRSGMYTVPLEENFAVAYWDQRGQGMSHGKFKESDITIAQMTDDLDAVIKVLKVKYGAWNKVVLLGHSWGGMLTAKYVVTGNNQSNIAAWIEADGAHDIPKLNKDAVRMFTRVANEQISAKNSLSNWQNVLEWASSVDTNNITLNQSNEVNFKGYEAEEWLINDNVMVSPESGGNSVPFLTGPINPLTSYLSGNRTNTVLSQEIENTSLTNELYKVTVPTLVLWGKYDFVVPPSLGLDTYKLISSTQKEIVLFENSGHSPMSNEWKYFSDVIITFIHSL